MNKPAPPIRDPYDFGPPVPQPREALWERLYRFFFGDDIFISYARSDAIRYVPSLAARLAAKKYICFFDQLVADPNEDLPETLKKKILRSTVFVLVGTKGAVSSSFVRKEIELFRRTRRPFIPIDVDGAVVDQQDWRDVIGVAKIHEEGTRVRDGDPSPEVVSLIKDSFRYTRRSQWLRASLLAGVGVISMTLVIALLVIWVAKAEAAAIKRRADSEVVAANQKVSQAEQRLQWITAEANKLKSDAADARYAENKATTGAQLAATRQETAERAMRLAQELERQSAERATETSRREEGSRAALLSREPGMEEKALSLSVQAAKLSMASGGKLPDEVFDGVVASAIAADYSLPLEGAGKFEVMPSVTVSPDGEKIVGDFWVSQYVSKLVVWDGRTGKITSQIPAVDGGMFLSSFSRDGKRFAAVTYIATGEGFIDLWESSGTGMRRLATPCGKGINATYSIALDSDGSHVIIGKPPAVWFSNQSDPRPPQVVVCELATGKEELLPGIENTFSVAFTPDDDPAVYSASLDSSGTSPRPFLYFPRSGRVRTLKLPAIGAPLPRFMSFADDGSIVLTVIDGKEAGQSRIYVESPDGNVSRLAGYRGAVISAAYVDGQARAVAISGRALRLVDGRSQPNFAVLRGPIRDVEIGEFSPHGRTILTVSDDGKGRLWDANTGRLRHTLDITDEYLVEGPLLQNRPKRAAFRADDKRLVTANDKGEVQTWDVDTGQLVCSAPGPNVSSEYPKGIPWGTPGGNYVNGVSFLADGDYVLAVYGSFINFLDAQTCKQVARFNFDEQMVDVSFSWDGRTMITTPVARTPAAALEDSEMMWWNLREINLGSGNPVMLSHSSLSHGYFRRHSPDGTLNLTSAGDTLQVLRHGEASPVRLEKAEIASSFDLQFTFSADGTRVAAVSGGEARVWDTGSGKLLVAFKDDIQTNWVRLLSLSPDGSKLLIAGKDNTVRIYPTSREDFLEVAKHLLGR
jgi:WD40 repeat protein